MCAAFELLLLEEEALVQLLSSILFLSCKLVLYIMHGMACA